MKLKKEMCPRGGKAIRVDPSKRFQLLTCPECGRTNLSLDRSSIRRDYDAPSEVFLAELPPHRIQVSTEAPKQAPMDPDYMSIDAYFIEARERRS